MTPTIEENAAALDSEQNRANHEQSQDRETDE